MKRASLSACALLFFAITAFTQMLPAGTEISIRTIDPINSKTADESKEYAASVDSAVVVQGVTVLPAKTRAFFRATDVVQPSIKNKASLSLSLVAVEVSGQRVPVETSKLVSAGGSPVKSTSKAVLIGGTAGAVFGLVVGGGKGAVLFGIVGGATGGLVSKFWHSAIVIPSESRFTYKLAHDAVMTYQAAPGAGGMPPQPPMTTEAIPAPIPAPPRPPEEVSLGETIDDVVRDFGKPEKIVPSDGKQVYFYKDMKVTFTDGKVSNIE